MKNIEKIKYLIIFTLILSLGIIYYQLDNYKKLTNNLLTQNNKISKQIEKLNQINKDLITKKDQEIKRLNNKIITKDEKILKLTIIKNTHDINYSINTPYFKNTPIEQKNDTLTTIDIVPSVKLDNQNKITGFKLQYQQQF